MKLIKILTAIFCLLMALPAAQAAEKIKLMWLGQSAFRLTTLSGKVIVIDPWLLGNPTTPEKYKKLENLGQVDLIVLTHAHGDHLGDAAPLAQLNKTRVLASGDLNQTLVNLGVLPPELAMRFNKGGTVTPWPGVRITATHAEHSSDFQWKNPQTGKTESHPGGEPIGLIIELENGFRIYHMGDTGLFGDMGFIASYYKPDVILIPIGGNFTMDPVDAAYATKTYLRPKFAIPIHYGANPLIKRTPEEYVRALGNTDTKVLSITPGTEVEF